MPRSRIGNELAVSRPPIFAFRLYIAGGTQNSVHALANLKALCSTHLRHRHKIEVVDVFQEPTRALADGIFMTPTLVKLRPSPVQRIVGTLSQPSIVIRTLGLETLAA